MLGRVCLAGYFFLSFFSPTPVLILEQYFQPVSPPTDIFFSAAAATIRHIPRACIARAARMLAKKLWPSFFSRYPGPARIQSVSAKMAFQPLDRVPSAYVPSRSPAGATLIFITAFFFICRCRSTPREPCAGQQ